MLPLILAVFMGVILLIIIGLVRLKLSVDSYENYWTRVAKEGGDITYLALGDSAAQGIGASSPDKGYVGAIASRIEAETGKSVRVVNVSKTGARIDDVIERQIPETVNLNPDIVTIEIGANNIRDYDESTFRKEFSLMLSQLPDNTYVSNMPYFGSRPALTENARRASLVIDELLKDYPSLNAVDLYSPTKANHSYLHYAVDFFHPNNTSYKNWTNAFFKEIDQSQFN